MPGDLLFFCTIRAFDVLLLYRTPCLDSSVCYPQHSFPKPCGLEFSQLYLSTLDLSYENVSIQYDRLQTYPSESSVNCLVAWPLEISTFPFSFSQEFDLGYSYFRLFSMWLHKIFIQKYTNPWRFHYVVIFHMVVVTSIPLMLCKNIQIYIGCYKMH